MRLGDDPITGCAIFELFLVEQYPPAFLKFQILIIAGGYFDMNGFPRKIDSG
jgi:hypothetical protein